MMRSRSGKPLKHLGRGYFVLLDKDEETEVSERAPGEAWLAVDRQEMRMSLILHPDSTDKNGMVTLSPRSGVAYAFGTGLDDVGLMIVQPIYGLVGPADTFNIDWNPMLDVMA